ncbi:MAG: signal peptidase I [Bryobacteraceae bacterium]|jgi:signal peptidase I
MPTPARFGFATALVLAGFNLLGALWTPVTALPPAIVFLLAVIGIWKGRAWSGYGGALFLGALVAGFCIGVARFPNPGATSGALVFVLVAAVCAGLPLVLAGRSLAGRKPSGSATAWIALAVATLIFTWCIRPFVIPTGAMEDTLRIADQMLVQVVGAHPHSRGDLVTFRYPVDPHQIFVKRIVATGGDRLRIRDKKLFVNGVAQNEPFAIHKMPESADPC